MFAFVLSDRLYSFRTRTMRAYLTILLILKCICSGFIKRFDLQKMLINVNGRFVCGNIVMKINAQHLLQRYYGSN